MLTINGFLTKNKVSRVDFMETTPTTYMTNRCFTRRYKFGFLVDRLFSLLSDLLVMLREPECISLRLQPQKATSQQRYFALGIHACSKYMVINSHFSTS